MCPARISLQFTMSTACRMVAHSPACSSRGSAPLAARPSPQRPLQPFSTAPATRRFARRQLQQPQATQQQRDATPSTSGGGDSSSGDFFAAGREGTERQRLFNTIAPVYDQLNDQLSFGLHRVWKRMAVKWSGARTGTRALDVCCGSGDLAFRLAEAVGPSGHVVGLDFSANMLADAERRQRERQASLGPAYDMQWVQVRRVCG